MDPGTKRRICWDVSERYAAVQWYHVKYQSRLSLIHIVCLTQDIINAALVTPIIFSNPTLNLFYRIYHLRHKAGTIIFSFGDFILLVALRWY